MVDVGIGMCGSLVLAVCITVVYIWQPNVCRRRMMETKTILRTKSQMESQDSEEMLMSYDGAWHKGGRVAANEIALMYRPPHPSELNVSVTIQSVPDICPRDGCPETKSVAKGGARHLNPTVAPETKSAKEDGVKHLNPMLAPPRR